MLKEFEEESINMNYQIIELDQLITDICKDFYLAAEKKNIKIAPLIPYLSINDVISLTPIYIFIFVIVYI